MTTVWVVHGLKSSDNSFSVIKYSEHFGCLLHYWQVKLYQVHYFSLWNRQKYVCILGSPLAWKHKRKVLIVMDFLLHIYFNELRNIRKLPFLADAKSFFPPTSNAKMRKLKHLHALRTYIEIPEVLWPFCTAAEVSIELPFDFKPINPIIHEEWSPSKITWPILKSYKNRTPTLKQI